MAGIAFGRFDDSFSVTSIKSYIAEFISTLLFVFAGVGSAIAYGWVPSLHPWSGLTFVSCVVILAEDVDHVQGS